MINSTIVYLPIGRVTFDMETAEKYRVESSDLLKEMSKKVYQPDQMITSVDELEQFLLSIKEPVDSILYQSTTFADGEFIAKVTEYFSVPVIVWSVREPSIGGRLRLNSLTGGNSTSHYLKNKKHPFSFIFGNPGEKALQYKLSSVLKVNHVIGKLKALKIGVVGDHPPGFFFSEADDQQLKQTFGIEMEKIDLTEAFQQALKLTEEDYQEELNRAEKQVLHFNRSDESVKRFAQFTTYIKRYIQQQNIKALAMRCWPNFFNELNAAPCSVLSQLTEDGTVTSCEADIHGSLSMYILQLLSQGNAPYLGDMVHINEEKNSVVFWHCGAGAYSLANPSTGAKAGVHPNRKMGFTLEFGLKPGKVTIFRVSYSAGKYRFYILKGEALDTPQAFHGTSVEVAFETDVESTVQTLMEEGIEPHYALIYDDVSEELTKLGRQLGIETYVFGLGRQ